MRFPQHRMAGTRADADRRSRRPAATLAARYRFAPRLSALLILVANWTCLADATFDWDLAADLGPGIRHTAATVELPNGAGLTNPGYAAFKPESPRKLRLAVVRVDSRHPEIRFTTTGRADRWGETMPEHRGQKLDQYTVRTARQRTRDFMIAERAAGRPVVLAINAAPWSPFSGAVVHPYADRMGLAISAGLLISPANDRPSLVVRDDGSIDLMATTAATDIGGIHLAISGFAFCLVDGRPVTPDTVLHPRTGVGIDATKRFLFLIVIDGRQAESQGATVSELGEWLLHYGAHTGLNLDGGGSTTMVRWDAENAAVVLLNRPAHGERRNGNNLGVYHRTDPAPSR